MNILYDRLNSKQSDRITICVDRYCKKFVPAIIRHMNDFVFITPDESDEDFTCKSICKLISSDKVALVMINFSYLHSEEKQKKFLKLYKQGLEEKMFTDISGEFNDLPRSQLAVFGMFHCGRIREEG